MTLRDRIQLFAVAVAVSIGAYACSSDSTPDGLATENNPTSDGTGTGSGSSTPAPSTTGNPGLSGNDGGGGGDGSVPVAPTYTFACPGSKIVPGINEAFEVDGKKRTLYADFPKDTSKPMAVIFSWHGFGDKAENFHKNLSFDPDLDPNTPAVIITPEDTGMLPPGGLAWDIAKGKEGDKNVDIAFFEAVLGCLRDQQKIDASRIYSFGFSAGAVMTNLIHSRHPKVLAAIITESGAWMNDKEERDITNFPGVQWNWPDLDPADRGNVLLTHGGKDDVTVLNILDLEKSAQFAIPFLKAGQRTVVDCAHTDGHTLHQEVLQPIMYKYLFAHRLGQPSPYQGGKIDGFPASCTLRLP